MLPDTLPEMIKARVSENGPSLLVQKRDGWSWKQITWKDFETDVRSIAAFLAGDGFKSGDRAFFECGGAYEGLVSETAVLMLGGVAVSGFAPGSRDTAGAKAAFAATPESAAEFASGGAKKAIFLSKSGGSKPGGAVVDFRAALKFGFLKSKKLTDELSAMFSSVGADAPAIEVRGRESEPQTFSQSGFMRALDSALTGAALSGDSQVFCHLPRADMFSRAVRFLPLCASARLAAAESEADFFADILEIMPTAVFLDSDGIKNAARLAEGRSAFGGRLERIFTDAAPNGEIAEFYSQKKVEVSEIFFRAV
ncbi:acyl-CoA synthetase family protein [Candidatus Mycalebacterium sp.]